MNSFTKMHKNTWIYRIQQFDLYNPVNPSDEHNRPPSKLSLLTGENKRKSRKEFSYFSLGTP